jgi:hypothetical protein
MLLSPALPPLVLLNAARKNQRFLFNTIRRSSTPIAPPPTQQTDMALA